MQRSSTKLREIARERDLSKLNLKRAQQALGSKQAKQKLAIDLTERAKQLVRKMGKASFETRSQIIRLVVPKEYGGRIILHWDGLISMARSRWEIRSSKCTRPRSTFGLSAGTDSDLANPGRLDDARVGDQAKALGLLAMQLMAAKSLDRHPPTM